ncbi:MAG: hypothetical protein LUI06_07670 [Ruminococcus sp.]|nr:hypothetical protein [Ruminococcus sp.]
MPGIATFGKKQKEESLNDKMVRLFKEGKTVDQISTELEVKADVITNVIRRRCGEDSIPETVIRSKNAMPQPVEDQPLKAEIAEQERAAAEAEVQAESLVEEQDVPTDGMTKLERYMLEKEKKKQQEAAEAAQEEEKPVEAEDVSMEGISTDNLDVFDEPAPEPEPVAAEETEMEGISEEEIPELSEDATIEDAPINEVVGAQPEEVVEPVEEPVAQAAVEETPAPSVPAPDFDIPAGAAGSAFDKMKAFAQAQIAANNAKLAELEAKLGSVEGDYTSQLEQTQKDLEEAKATYENVLNEGDEIAEKRNKLQAEHRAAIARADEDYRKKLAELDEEYNNATAHANKVMNEKEAEINERADANNAAKETAKNNFLDTQAKVNELKDKIENEVDSVKAQIESIKEENKGYESFMV